MLNFHKQQEAAPQNVVPVYSIHTLENPFCPVPWCKCHDNQEEIAKLLQQVSDGMLTIREAADFADEKLVY
jgi:hypothetical protein